MDVIQAAYDDVDMDDKIIEEFDELVCMCFMMMVVFANLFDIFKLLRA